MTAHSGTPSPSDSPYPNMLQNERSVVAAIHRDQVLVGYLESPAGQLVDQILNMANESAQSASTAMQSRVDDEALLMMTGSLLEKSVDLACDVMESCFHRSVCAIPDHISLQLPYEKNRAGPVDNQELLSLQSAVDREHERLAGLRHLQHVIRRQLGALESQINNLSDDLRSWSQLVHGSSSTMRTLPNEALVQVHAAQLESAKEPVPDVNVGPNDSKHSAWLQEQLTRALDQ